MRLPKNVGLANRGDPIALWDDAGQLISTFGGSFDVSDRRHDGQSIERINTAACDTPDNWRLHPENSASPGLPAAP